MNVRAVAGSIAGRLGDGEVQSASTLEVGGEFVVLNHGGVRAVGCDVQHASRGGLGDGDEAGRLAVRDLGVGGGCVGAVAARINSVGVARVRRTVLVSVIIPRT